MRQAARESTVRTAWLRALLAAALGGLWCVALLAARVAYSGSLTGAFLLWNLVLAGLPLLAAGAYAWAGTGRGGGLQVGFQSATGALWLLLLPNAPYLVTDLIHLTHRPPVPLWFDAALLGSFACVGVLLGVLAVATVHDATTARHGRVAGWTLAVVSLLLCGVGIWLGRVLRWNSWDLLVDPLRSVGHLWGLIASGARPHGAIALALVYGGGSLLGYLVIRASAGALRSEWSVSRDASGA